MSSGDEASGSGARRISTKPSGSTHATLPCSASTQDPISTVVISQKRCERLIRFSTSYRTTWKQARNELEPFLKEQPENWILIGDVALTNIGLGDKAAAFAFVEKGMMVVPIEKDALDGPGPIEILARVAAQMRELDRAIAALQKLLSIPYEGPLAGNVPLTPAF